MCKLRKEGAALTEKEDEVMRHVCAGLENWEIGEEMKRSPNTVKQWVRGAMAKLGAVNRTQAAVIYVQSRVMH